MKRHDGCRLTGSPANVAPSSLETTSRAEAPPPARDSHHAKGRLRRNLGRVGSKGGRARAYGHGFLRARRSDSETSMNTSLPLYFACGAATMFAAITIGRAYGGPPDHVY